MNAPFSSTSAKLAAWLLAVFAPLAAVQAQTHYSAPLYTFTTLAGSTGISGAIDGSASGPRFNFPYGVAADSAGNVYVADSNNQTIRKITPAGVVTTFAGTAGSIGSTDGTSSAARFNQPLGVAVDAAGNVYVADNGNSTIRKITPAGVVTTLAGTAGSTGPADGTGGAAQFYGPTGVAVDGAGNVFVADTNSHTIRMVTPAGVVTTLAGLAGSAGSTNGTGSAARFNTPCGIAVDGSGNLFVADTVNKLIRKIAPGGVVTTFAGVADPMHLDQQFNSLFGVAVDAGGNLYVTETNNHTIRKVSSTGTIMEFAGAPGSYGQVDGTGVAARFQYPRGIAVDGSGNVYVADTSNQLIRKITSAAVVTTLAGTATRVGATDGTGSAALFYLPYSAAVDGAGNVYIADYGNHTIRKISSAGVVTTLAGAAGLTGSTDGTGSAARFNQPLGVTVDPSGNVFVADSANHTVRKITPAGVVTTLAGLAGSAGTADGTGSAARFGGPTGVAADATGNVFVADGNTIRKVTAAGVVTTVAGLGGFSGFADGTGNAARFNGAVGVAVDGAGNIFVAEAVNYTIRKVTSAGVVTTLAGSPGAYGYIDATGSAARFKDVFGISVDGAGNLYVADPSNQAIRKVTSAGVVTTLGGGSGGSIGGADGPATTVQFSSPHGVASDSSGRVYIADTNDDTIRQGWPIVPTDFNSDGRTDIVWENTVTGNRGFWLMNGTTFASWVDVGIVSTDWHVAGTGDFNGDGQTDILWENTSTGERGCWLMNGTTFTGWAIIGGGPISRRITGVGDFTGDGMPDLFWTDTVTGDRQIWQMIGHSQGTTYDIGIIPLEWRVGGVADFNGDGQADILWENTATGARGFWLMNGTSFASWVGIGVISTDWHIVATADFNGDGQPDILWENSTTGDRGFWLMNGTTFSSWVDIGIISTDWHIAN